MRVRREAVAALLAAALVATGAWISEAQVSSDVIDQAIARTVLLILLDKNGDAFGGSCSGSFVTPAGLILTAAHCVRAHQDESKLGIRKGELFNPNGLLAVAVNLPNHVKPVVALVAQRVADEPELDFALLKTIGFLGKGGSITPLPGDFRAPFMRFGDSNKVRIGDPIAVVGFPGHGGETVTAPQGHVTGFTADNQDNKLHLKHDANAGQGASGGPVITADGSEVAVAVLEAGEKGPAGSFFGIMTNHIPRTWAQFFQQGVPPQPQPPQPQPQPPQPQPPQPPRPVPQPGPAAGVAVQGTIVDADSGAGIPGAFFALFRPGVSPRAASEQDLVAVGRTDGRGFFQTAPGVPRGPTYPVLVLAKGYRVIEASLPIESGDPDVVPLKPIAMQRQQ